MISGWAGAETQVVASSIPKSVGSAAQKWLTGCGRRSDPGRTVCSTRHLARAFILGQPGVLESALRRPQRPMPLGRSTPLGRSSRDIRSGSSRCCVCHSVPHRGPDGGRAWIVLPWLMAFSGHAAARNFVVSGVGLLSILAVLAMPNYRATEVGRPVRHRQSGSPQGDCLCAAAAASASAVPCSPGTFTSCLQARGAHSRGRGFDDRVGVGSQSWNSTTLIRDSFHARVGQHELGG